MNAPVGVVVALLSEAKALGLKHPRPGLNSGGLPTLQIYVSGMREGPAREAATALADAGVAALLSFGTAGGLDPALSAGAVVCPQRVLYMDGHVVEADAAWRARLVARCADIELIDGMILTTRQTLLNSGIKYLARTQSQAVAVDQESSAIADVARARGLPFLALRAIVDDAEATLPLAVVDGVDAYGRARPLAMIGGLLQSPWQISKLPGLARAFADARRSLRTIVKCAPDFGWNPDTR